MQSLETISKLQASASIREFGNPSVSEESIKISALYKYLNGFFTFPIKEAL